MTRTLMARNRELLRAANRLMLERIRHLKSLFQRVATFRSDLQVEEGIEVAGLEAYSIEEPAERIDFARLGVPWDLAPLALLNEQVKARRFEADVENEFVVVMDRSSPMAYPLRGLYAGADVGRLTPEQIARSKPGLAKTVAAVFVQMAIESGFRTRLVTCDAAGIQVGPARRRPDVLSELMEPLDEHFMALARRGGDEEGASYSLVAEEMMLRKGVFLFVGDFLGGGLAWGDRRGRERWLRALELFVEWGRRRSLLVVRVNHWFEVRPPSVGVGGQVAHPFGDRIGERPHFAAGLPASVWHEGKPEALERLRLQQKWQRVLGPTLRKTCRGFVGVHGGMRLDRELRKVWSRFVER